MEGNSTEEEPGEETNCWCAKGAKVNFIAGTDLKAFIMTGSYLST